MFNFRKFSSRGFTAAAAILLSLVLLSGCGGSNNGDINAVTGQQGNPTFALAFAPQPGGAIVGETFTVNVEIRDSGGQLVTSTAVPITISLTTPNGATLSGTLTQDSVNGVATFSDLSIDTAGEYTLTASVEGFIPAVSDPFRVNDRLLLGSAHAAFGGPRGRSALVRLNPQTGAYLGSLGIIGDGTEFATVHDIICVANDRLLGTAIRRGNPQQSVLIEVDRTNPANSSIIGQISDQGNNGFQIADLAYDADTDTLYASGHQNQGSNHTILVVNQTTGVGTPLPNPTGFDGAGHAIAIDPTTGTLYGNNDNFFSIDKTTGIGTEINDGSGLQDRAALCFQPGTQTLFGANRNNYNSFENGDQGSEFGTINVADGAFTQISFTDPVALTGLTFCSVAPEIPQNTLNFTTSNPTFTFDDISGTGTALNFTDDDEDTADIGFTFQFDGEDFSQVAITSNGTIAFGAIANWGYIESSLPEPSIGELVVYWTDLNPGNANSDNVYFETLGTAPNRRFVVQWNQIEDISGTGNPGTFQAVLFEGSNEIEYRYQDVDFGDPSRNFGGTATVGLQKLNAAIESFSHGTPNLPNSTSIRYSPVTP